MPDLPSFADYGEVARLFPVVADTSKEQRAASIFLSVISAIPALANALLSQIGQRVGARSSVNTFTEVVLKNGSQTDIKDRPDGLIEISFGKRKWTALVEAKIGRNPLDKDQIERYLRLARDNSIDALITVSNEFAAHPTHHPVQISKNLMRRVSLYHFSWTSIFLPFIFLSFAFLVSKIKTPLSQPNVLVGGLLFFISIEVITLFL